MTLNDLAKKFDHTLLKATAAEADIRKLCEEARADGFASVCVNPCWVSLCADLLQRHVAFWYARSSGFP